MRRQRRLARHLARGDREHLGAVLARGDAQELPQRVGVGAARGGALRQSMPWRAIRLSRSWPRCAGIQPARQAHGAQRLRQELEAGALELAAQEAVVEARVVRDEDPAGEALVELAGELCEARRARDHLAG